MNINLPASGKAVRAVEIATAYARGYACRPGSCAGSDSMFVSIRLGPLRIRGDSASVGVAVHPWQNPDAQFWHIYRHRYELARPVPAINVWFLYARFDEGHETLLNRAPR